MKLIAIAGGSGCGKSSLAYALKKKYPNVEVFHFDDYQRDIKDVPLFEGMTNWDCPEAIDFDKLLIDLKKLLSGKEIVVMTKSSVLNPEYEEKGRIKHTLKPKEFIFMEGYLALYNERLRELYDFMIFLDIPIEESLKRRCKNIGYDDFKYNKLILKPMHKKYVEPTKKYADLVIDVVKNNKEEAMRIVENNLSILSV